MDSLEKKIFAKVGKRGVCVYLGAAAAYLVLWKTLEEGIGWNVSPQEQLSIFSRREAAEQQQEERQHLNRMALEGSRAVKGAKSELIVREKGKKAVIHKCEESDWCLCCAKAASLENTAAEKGQPGKDSGQKQDMLSSLPFSLSAISGTKKLSLCRETSNSLFFA